MQSTGEIRIRVNLSLELVIEAGANLCRENLLTTDEVAALIPDINDKLWRDIVRATRDANGALDE